MRYSQIFPKTLREAPSEAESINAKLLTRAGFIHQEMAGVYSFLPLGWRVLNKIENIVRDEMNKVGAQELFLPGLHPKKNWEITGRWDSFDALFKLKSRFDQEYALGPTHEEILYPLVKHYISSYKDLPLSLYQIQTKFRDEPRAKGGLLRGREFRMKDLYSFHATSKDRDEYYEVMRKAYLATFARLGLDAIETKATGGTFSDLSLEFQVACEAGEDVIFVCQSCKIAVNKELSSKTKCPTCGGETKETKAAEVGNIFPLKDKFSKDFNLTFKDRDGQEKLVFAGCYGIGTSRTMGVLVEVFCDDRGIVWPEKVAPYQCHLVQVTSEKSKVKSLGEEIYEKLQKAGVEVLYDDREEVSAGERFTDADLIGIPVRLVVSEKTEDKIEWKKRTEDKTELVTIDETLSRLAK